jgi:hypothetical protein
MDFTVVMIIVGGAVLLAMGVVLVRKLRIATSPFEEEEEPSRAELRTLLNQQLSERNESQESDPPHSSTS